MINKKINELLTEDPINNANISDRYNKWISNISPSNKKIFESLFCDIKYYSEQKLREILSNLFNSLNPNEAFLNETLFLYIESQQSKLNSSHIMTNFLIETNNIVKNLCSLENIKEFGYSPQNIILCDDFIGTGKTVKDFIIKNFDVLCDKNIIILAIHCMEEGKQNILEFAKENNININIYCFENSKKYFNDINPNLLQQYLRECNNLGIATDQLGRSKSESIVVLYRNTPNNTLGAIWKNTDKNIAIFPRKITKTPTCRKMNKEKRNRRMERYINGSKD